MQPPSDLSLEELEVRRWRRETLLRAGFDKEAADALSARADVDLHAAVELVERAGCEAALAILL